ncbi:MAG: YhjD/YihY/BrkB family envelope integrity protein [Acidobacteriota bacterium]
MAIRDLRPRRRPPEESVETTATKGVRRSFFQWYRDARRWVWATFTDEAVLIYRRSAHGRTRVRVLTVETFLFLREIIREFYSVEASSLADSLAYTTLLSLVPLLVAFQSVITKYFLKVFPEFAGNFETFLNVIVPYQSSQIAAELHKFTTNAAGLSSVASIFFLVVAFRLFMAVEDTVNRIWHVKNVRGYRQRIRAFTMLLFWGPVLIALSFTTSTSLENNPYIGRFLVSTNLMIFVVICVAFIMLFWLVPSTHVKLKSAVVGGVITALLFHAVRFGFGLYTRSLLEGRMNLIYGTVGLALIFLIAIDLMWMVILLGVEISYVFQNLRGILRASEQNLESDPKFNIYFALRAMIEIARRFEAREDAPSSYRLAEEFSATDKQMTWILRRLEDGRLVKETGGDWAGFVPGGDPNRIQVEEVIHCIAGTTRSIPNPAVLDTQKAALAHIFEIMDNCTGEALKQYTVGRLVRELYSRDAGRKSDPAAAPA